MSLATLISRILGYVRDALLTAMLNPTAKDAFLVAFRLPNMFRRLLGEGSLSVSFIPVFVDHLSRPEDQVKAKNLSASIFTLLMIVSSILSVLGILFMEQLLGEVLSGKGYQQIPGKMDMTVLLARIMFFYLFLITSYAYLMAILNALKSFFIPALAPALFNFVFILALLTPAEWSDGLEQNVAWGVLIGGAVQVLVVSYALVKKGFFPGISFVFNSPSVKKVLFNMIPGMLGLGILQLMSLFNIYFASRLHEGSHTYIYLADRILELPQSLIAVSLGVALLPTLSEKWAQGKRLEMIEMGQSHLKLLLFLSLPSAVGMFVLAKPIVEVLFMRGEFSEVDVQQTLLVVQLYSFLLIASSVVKVIAPSFYAIKNTWVPALISALCLLLHVVVANQWTYYFGLQGLVGSTVLSGFVNAFLLYVFYQKFIGKLSLIQLIKDLWPLVISISFMAFTITKSYLLISNGLHALISPSWARGLALGASMALGGTVYFYVCSLMRVKESQAIISLFKRKLKIK